MKHHIPPLCFALLIGFILVWLSPTTDAQDAGSDQKAEEQPTKNTEKSDQESKQDQDQSDEREENQNEQEAESDDDQPTLDELLRLEEEKRERENDAADNEEESDILKELDESSSSLSEDPAQLFLDAADRMRRSARRLLDLRDAGLETQRLQEEAILKLDILIDQARQRKRQPQSQPQSQDQNQNPQQQQQPNAQPGSSENQDQDTRPGFQEQEMDGALEEGGLEWGNLPPRTRDMLTQGRYDLASSIYRRMTELYYRRLAEESDQ